MSELAPPFEVLRRGSPSLADLLGWASRAALSDAPLLILGEAGTGRSALARAIHAVSERRRGPLVEVDPGSLPAALFESELFGHVAGAFTGADEAVAGRVARAEGGSLLLDHVEETPMAAQAKLLRVLAEQRYAPLGGRETTADVRFLAIGPDDLADRIEEGTFRSDLFFRLEVVTLHLPALRHRMVDLAPLVEHFLGDLAQRFDRQPLSLASSAMRWMERYDWPGNLRELWNVLEREAVMAKGGEINPAPPSRLSGRPGSLAEIERKHLERVLEYTRGHQGRAAEILGISRKALWQKRRRYGLP